MPLPPLLAASIPSLLEKPIMLRHLLANMFEPQRQTNQPVVPFNALPPQLPTIEHGTIMLRPLCVHSQNHQHISFLF
jgi:hypothetical protein